MRNIFAKANPLLMAVYSPSQITNTNENGQQAMLESPSEKRKLDRENMETAMFEAVEARAAGDLRAIAASMIAGWVEDGEPEAMDFDALAIVMCGLQDVEEDAEFTDEQVDAYYAALTALADAAVSLGADQGDVTAMIDDEDDDAASRVFDSLSAGTDSMDESIADYTIFGGDDAMLEAVAMFEATRRKKVVRNGKVTIIRKRVRPRRLNSKQKAALKKARRRANTSVAKMHRAKSNKIRQKRGLNK